MSNIVLIHGAYQGGWIWKPLAKVLRDKGHYVLAPTLEGCGERGYQLHKKISTESHALEIANLLFFGISILNLLDRYLPVILKLSSLISLQVP